MVRQRTGRLPQADNARAVHLRVLRPSFGRRARQWRCQCHHLDRCTVHQTGLSRRDADHLDLAHRTRQGGVPHRGCWGLRPRRRRRAAGARGRRGGIPDLTARPRKQLIRSNRFTGAAIVAASGMAFKLTYSDGQETDYDDSTKWEVENGVVKMGREAGKWTVFVSPSHWATLEIVAGKNKDNGEGRDGGEDKGKDEGRDHDEDNGKDDDEDEDT